MEDNSDEPNQHPDEWVREGEPGSGAPADTVAESARKLAGLWETARDAVAKLDDLRPGDRLPRGVNRERERAKNETRMEAVEACARAISPQVERAFLCLTRGGVL